MSVYSVYDWCGGPLYTTHCDVSVSYYFEYTCMAGHGMEWVLLEWMLCIALSQYPRFECQSCIAPGFSTSPVPLARRSRPLDRLKRFLKWSSTIHCSLLLFTLRNTLKRNMYTKSSKWNKKQQNYIKLNYSFET